MKHLLLLRHAKATPSERGMADRDRPLAERGHRDAKLMGAAIAKMGLPDLILCSPARRTRETLAEMLSAFPREPNTAFVPNLYGQQATTYAGIIALMGGIAERLLVIGHNPTVHATAMAYVGTGDRHLRASLAAKYPTCALAIFDIDTDSWATAKAGELAAFLRPRDLGAVDADD